MQNDGPPDSMAPLQDTLIRLLDEVPGMGGVW